MNLKNISTKYLLKKLELTDSAIVYDLCKDNKNYYEFRPPFVTKESIERDMLSSPPNKTLDDCYYIGVFENDNLIAVLHLVDKYPNNKTLYIAFFMVKFDIQNKGIGKFIINELFKYLKNKNYEEIRLGFVSKNEEAKRFWFNNGFIESHKVDDITVAYKKI